MPSRNITVGIDIGTYSTNTAVLEMMKKEGATKILSLSSAPSFGVRKGDIVDVKEAAKSIKNSIKQAEKSAGISIRSVYVSINGSNLSSSVSKGIVAVSRTDGEITESDVKRSIAVCESNIPRMANKSIIHTFPLSYKIDNEITEKNPVGMKGGKLEAETMFVTTLSQNLNHLIKSVEMAGLKIEDIIAAPIAASRIILERKQKEVGSLLLDVGGGTASLTVFEEGMPISVGVFPFGGDNITNDIALVLQISLSEAEKLKHILNVENTEIDRQTNKKLNDIIEARLNDIFELTTNHLKKINRERLLPGGVVLTGGSSNLTNVVYLAKNYLKMPTDLGVVLGLETKEKKFFDGKWSVALGLAYYGLDETPMYSGIEMINKTKKFLSRWLKTFIP